MSFGRDKRVLDRHLQLVAPLAQRDFSGIPSVNKFMKLHKTTFGTIKNIRDTEMYKDWVLKLKRTQTKVMKEEFKEFAETTKGKLREYSDEAPAVLFGIMMDEKQRAAARIAAATEILDRDGRFAKVSRQMQVKEGADGAPMLPEDAALEMLDALEEHKKHLKDKVN